MRTASVKIPTTLTLSPEPTAFTHSTCLLPLVNRLVSRFSDAVLNGGLSWWNGLGRLAISGMHGERPSARN